MVRRTAVPAKLGRTLPCGCVLCSRNLGACWKVEVWSLVKPSSLFFRWYVQYRLHQSCPRHLLMSLLSHQPAVQQVMRRVVHQCNSTVVTTKWPSVHCMTLKWKTKKRKIVSNLKRWEVIFFKCTNSKHIGVRVPPTIRSYVWLQLTRHGFESWRTLNLDVIRTVTWGFWRVTEASHPIPAQRQGNTCDFCKALLTLCK